MNTRIILASVSFLALGAFLALPAVASAPGSLGLTGPAVLAANNSVDVKDNGASKDGIGDLGLAAPTTLRAPLQLADNSGDGVGDSGSSSSDGHGDGKGSGDSGSSSSDGHGHSDGKGSSDGHGTSGHSSSGQPRLTPTAPSLARARNCLRADGRGQRGPSRPRIAQSDVTINLAASGGHFFAIALSRQSSHYFGTLK